MARPQKAGFDFMMADYNNMLQAYKDELGGLTGEDREKRIRDIGC